MSTETIAKTRKAPGTSPAYKPTPGALLDLAVATENGSLRDHPLRKVEPGVYSAADGRFTVARDKGRWLVNDTLAGQTLTATSYENARLVVNQAVGERLDGAAAVTDQVTVETVTAAIEEVGRKARGARRPRK